MFLVSFIRKEVDNKHERKLKHDASPKFCTINEYHEDNYFICPYRKGWEYLSGFIPGIPLTRGPP